MGTTLVLKYGAKRGEEGSVRLRDEPPPDPGDATLPAFFFFFLVNIRVKTPDRGGGARRQAAPGACRSKSSLILSSMHTIKM